jgi:RNA polymerase sigma-70 factor (ECF subfamily)
MDDAERVRLEGEVRALVERGDHAGAATHALRGYGPELFGFLVATLHSEQDASDVFADLAEALWRGIARFSWESTLRTWAYAIARNASRRFRRDAGRRARREARAGESALDGVAAAVRTQTLTFLRTAQRTRLETLRDALDPDDRTLLVLRVDRRLEWIDVARVFASDVEGPDAETLAREASRLRKRFQLVKERLHALARKEGLVGDG